MPKRSLYLRRPPDRRNTCKRKISQLPLIAIGASTGGPNALQTILSKWPKDFPASVLIAQHISADFADSLAAWLSNNCQLTVRTVHATATGLRQESCWWREPTIIW